jgi:hypothetical protein
VPTKRDAANVGFIYWQLLGEMEDASTQMDSEDVQSVYFWCYQVLYRRVSCEPSTLCHACIHVVLACLSAVREDIWVDYHSGTQPHNAVLSADLVKRHMSSSDIQLPIILIRLIVCTDISM